MAYEKLDTRVLGRVGARVITEEEMAKVTGGGELHLPTSHLSRDASGRPLDITQD
jgi:bacteriocin-like protein